MLHGRKRFASKTGQLFRNHTLPWEKKKGGARFKRGEGKRVLHSCERTKGAQRRKKKG